MTDSLSLDAVAPMSSMMALGNIVLVGSELTLVGYMSAIGLTATSEKALESPVTNWIAAIPYGALEMAKSMGPVLLSLVGIAMAFGAMLAYILPMVSYFMWTFAVMGCACYAAEVVVAAPLAAFSHIRMDGQELINQEQKTIYGIVFNAFLRPTVLLLGLIIANMIFAVMAGYVNSTFGVAMISSQGNNFIGGIGILTMLGVLMFMHYQLAVRSFSLIHDIPKTVSNILGVHMDGDRGDSEHGKAVMGGIANFNKTTGAGAVSGLMRPKSTDEEKKGVKKTPGAGGAGAAATTGAVKGAADDSASPAPAEPKKKD